MLVTVNPAALSVVRAVAADPDWVVPFKMRILTPALLVGLGVGELVGLGVA